MKIKRHLISRLLEELPFFEVRNLKPNEKGKSLDYWEGHTDAVVKLIKYLKKG